TPPGESSPETAKGAAPPKRRPRPTCVTGGDGRGSHPHAHAAHSTHAAHAAGHAALVVVLGTIGDHGLGGQHEARHGGGVLQRGAGHLGRVDDARGQQVLEGTGRGVEAVRVLAVLDLVDDDAALETAVGDDLAQGLLDRAADDLHAEGLLIADLEAVERLQGADEGHAAAGDDALLDGRAGRVERILHAGLLLLHLGLGGRTDVDHRDAADQLREALLELLAVVVGRGLLDLRTDLAHAGLDVVLLARAI